MDIYIFIFSSCYLLVYLAIYLTCIKITIKCSKITLTRQIFCVIRFFISLPCLNFIFLLELFTHIFHILTQKSKLECYKCKPMDWNLIAVKTSIFDLSNKLVNNFSTVLISSYCYIENLTISLRIRSVSYFLNKNKNTIQQN